MRRNLVRVGRSWGPLRASDFAAAVVEEGVVEVAVVVVVEAFMGTMESVSAASGWNSERCRTRSFDSSRGE
jgi:hypothetical protein